MSVKNLMNYFPLNKNLVVIKNFIKNLILGKELIIEQGDKLKS